MADISSADALDSVRVRFRVLARARPGETITLDAAGRWTLQAPSTSSWMPSWKSAARKLWSLISPSPVESQRQAFLKSAKESVRMLIHHCRLLMKTQLFNRALDDTGTLSVKNMQKLNAVEVSDLEVLLQNLQSFCNDLHDGIGGLTNVLQHQPYADDLTFCSEVQVSLCDPVRQFLDQTYRRLGQFAPKLLPFVNPQQPQHQQHIHTDVKAHVPPPMPGFSVHLPLTPAPPASPPLQDDPIVPQNPLPRPPSVASNLAASATPTAKLSLAKK